MKKNMLPLIGLVSGAALVVWSILIAGDIMSFLDTPSIIITVFGSFAALMISFPFKTLLNIPKVMKVLLSDPKDKRVDLVNLFAELSRKARKDGLLALENDIETIHNEYMIEGLKMVIDGVEPDTIKEIMELKLDTMERRHRSGQEVFEKWAELAPAFGMLGTLIGLVIMLSGLDDPDAIGPGMATALLTTFYGSLLANLIFIPMASNLSLQTDEEVFTGEMVIDGILQIQAGANPRLLEEKLKTYLSTDELKLLSSEKEDEVGAASYE
ncbi:motility protein A [Tissierella creatinophila]|uniref:Chemotaxis protein PomA n=1 Tax=Tissierella creatinophila DSM 6911 TaxID=1123403 RepID=A0A1U7M904_TISCR|nr:motility protein A [Tissierella creatinophila]OLS03765.1 chemotaxis protein PomA [Tissierella creatinophila DSM 6911]